MKIHFRCVLIGFLSLSFFVYAQTVSSNPPEPSPSAQVPRLIRFSGVATGASGKPLAGTVGITFSLYGDQQSGAPLWVETQNVEPDHSGHYTVLLGSTKSAGVPAEMFATGEAQWLGVQPQGEVEQPRVFMVSVPYALKAVDADTLGGKPASAFMAAPNSSGASVNGTTVAHNAGAAGNASAVSGSGTTNYVPLWLSSSTLGNSKLFQSTAGNVGIGTTSPAAALDVHGAVNAASGFNLGGSAFAFGSFSNRNAFLGFSGNSAITGQYNTASGAVALSHNTTASSNTASGFAALYANTTGNDNTASGAFALYYGTTGTLNTALGYGAGPDSDSPNLTNTTAIGAKAVVSESNALVLGGTGSYAVKVGIGTAKPASALDVVGAINTSTSFNLGGIPLRSGPMGMRTPFWALRGTPR